MHVESLDKPCDLTCVHKALSGKPEAKTSLASFDIKYTRLGLKKAR